MKQKMIVMSGCMAMYSTAQMQLYNMHISHKRASVLTFVKRVNFISICRIDSE